MWRYLVSFTLGSLLSLWPCFAQTLPAVTTSPATQAADDRLTPTLVTMQCTAAPARDVLEQLAHQAGITCSPLSADQWARANTITLDVKDQPFWPVFLDACRQAKVRLNAYNLRPDHISVDPGYECTLFGVPACQTAGWLIMAVHAHRNYSINYEAPKKRSLAFSVQTMILADPKYRLATGDVFLRLVSAVDENGVSLCPDNDASTGSPAGRNSLSCQTSITLVYPSNAGRRIARLEGVMHVPVLLKEETWEIGDVMDGKPKTREIGECVLTIKSVSKSQNMANGYEVRYVMEDPAADPLQGGMGSSSWQLSSGMELYAADGTRLQLSGSGYNGTECSARFFGQNGQAVPVRIVWHLPVKTRVVRLPFTLTDLAIP